MDSKKLQDLDLSQDEIKRFSEALKDDKFREMLREYAEEISDPENRRRYEEEITQMEKERGMDITFIRPEPGYVLKTSVNGEKKAFINISKSDRIDKPHSERKQNTDGKSGLLWHIPHSFAPPREDLDKEKNRCFVYDFVVHSETYRMTESNIKFKQMVEDTAIDGIEKQFNVKLDRKNLKRPKMKFKGVPAPTVIRNRNAAGPQTISDASGLLKDMPYPYGDQTTLEKMKDQEDKFKNNQEKTKSDLGSHRIKKEDQATTPKYTIIHRSEIDVQDFRNAPDAKPSTRPRELVIKIELPLLSRAAQANLDVFEKRLHLESTTPAAYKLDLSLPYPVDEKEGSAKFDKQKRTLIVTLPVIPESLPIMPTFVNGSASPAEEENQLVDKPFIEVLKDDINGQTIASQELVSAEERTNGDATTCSLNSEKVFFPNISYGLPEFTFTQDMETVSFVLKVKNVTEDSIKRTSPSSSEVKLVCTSRGEGGFPLHFSLVLHFAESCQLVPEHSSVDVTTDNVVLLLLKERKSRGLWDRFWAGLDSDDMQEHLFLTTNNLQRQLTELDEASAVQTEQVTAPNGHAAVYQPCELEVTAMNEKKLTIKISPQKRNDEEELKAEEEDDYDPPSSADIEVVHTQPSPTLHGILKQRTVSESSEDFHPDPDSPRSPVEDEDELSSSCNSSGKRRSVSFSKHIDKATFKSCASVNSMKTALKCKRKRHRKWEEKKDKASTRRRSNSTGSEGSGDDHSYSLSDSHSYSEEEFLAEGGKQGQSDQAEMDEDVSARFETVLDFRTKASSVKFTGNIEPNISVSNSSLFCSVRQSQGDETSGEENHGDPSSINAAQNEGSDTDSIIDGSIDEGYILTNSIESTKLAETNGNDENDSDDEVRDEETNGKEEMTSTSSDAATNEHRTECAFAFSNEVMFDLEIE